MHPAPSIIIFTVLSGLGFGLLAFLGLGMPTVFGSVAFGYFTIAYLLAVVGLASSAFHLGNPQRALKAFTQWRSSWLSREACLSVATLVVMAIYGGALVFFNTKLSTLGLIGSVLALATVFATSMIYGQLKTVPRWNSWTTPALFVTLSLAGGALLAGQVVFTLAFLVVAGILQVIAWMLGDGRFEQAGSTQETATGLGAIGTVRHFEAPHTGTNYLLREMVHHVGRKHAQTLRVISLILMVILPVILLWLGVTYVTVALAAISHIAGTLASRWLFFAEAEHVVGLYYGQR
ncbi:DmsC/YnfH family molybdoenzyme membrane anchor subunit [Cognatishimia sp. MH4019]|uniref:dimethyl sulfoxide reductase anchor subunit family protein n=1 Tax=Cognatishimia sp. MH4019 TaxID=2854030 RepID=UPI001CD53987|nr:DmsC/YnfH family molybdoenzyme membrane anchor subunit [Cognatishimia sp. MH4019]